MIGTMLYTKFISFIAIILFIVSCFNDHQFSGSIWIEKSKKDCNRKGFYTDKEYLDLKKIEFINERNIILNDSTNIRITHLNDSIMIFVKPLEIKTDLDDTIYLQFLSDSTLSWRSSFWVDNSTVTRKNIQNPENFTSFFSKYSQDTAFQQSRINYPIYQIEMDTNQNICNHIYACRYTFYLSHHDQQIIIDSLSPKKIHAIGKSKSISMGNTMNDHFEFSLIFNEWYLTKIVYYQ